MTVAFSVETEKKLDLVEEHHICPEKALAELLARGKSIASQAQRN
jgi:uncharacterized tellurite resistance protein B-like protein